MPSLWVGTDYREESGLKLGRNSIVERSLSSEPTTAKRAD